MLPQIPMTPCGNSEWLVFYQTLRAMLAYTLQYSKTMRIPTVSLAEFYLRLQYRRSAALRETLGRWNIR